FMGDHAVVTDGKGITQGGGALRISVVEAQDARGIEMTGERLQGWEKYRWIAVDVYNSGDQDSPVAMRFDDAQSRNYQTRCTTEDKVLRPGANTLRVPLEALKRQNGDAFDVSTLKCVLIYVWQPTHAFDMVIDNLRLEEPLAPGAVVKAAPPRLLCGFENDADLDRVDITGEKSFVEDPAQVMEGKAALKLSVKGGKGSIIVELMGDRLKGWETFEAVSFDVFNLTKSRLPIAVRFDDAESVDFQTRCTLEDLTLRPGANTLRVKLADLVRQNGDAFDLSTLKRMVIFIWQPKEDTEVVIDNLRLTGGSVVTAQGRSKGRAPRLVTGFEDADEIKRMEFEGSTASLTNQPERVTQGKAALAVTFSKTSPWPGFRIVDAPLLSGWAGYDQLTMDVFNLTDRKFGITFRFDDARTDRYEMRAHAEAILQPGKNSVVILLKALRRENGEPFDLSTLKAVIPHLGKSDEDVHLVFDNWTLRTDEGATVDVENAHLFDFGGEATVTFSGFVKVTDKTRFTAAKGYGFVNTQGLSGSGRGMPDDLAGDHVAGRDLHFRVKVPDGEYKVACIVGNASAGYTVNVASGDSRVSFRKQAPAFWSAEGAWRGIDDDYYPDKDMWTAYIEPDYPMHTGTVTVADGQVELTGSAQLAALVVYPVAQEAKMKPLLDEMLKRRREQFAREYCTVEVPKSKVPEPTPT
ncbi:MAG TPA: hypothetical protein VMX57_04715, partial [Planctomycetota bacterium]|nr:hypothetical protein [Planctomycetota bacterium]